MFGREVSDEITLDLAKIKGPLVFLNIFAAWAVGLNSLTKIPLGMKMVRPSDPSTGVIVAER